jgi:NADPH:quinone reductase-like Zn-dependent oxidoreductase
LSPGGIYATVGGSTIRLLQALVLGPFISLSGKKIRIVGLKQNKDLEYMNELFEAGKVKPVIDRLYMLEELPEAMKRFGEASHQGKVVITIGPDHVD